MTLLAMGLLFVMHAALIYIVKAIVNDDGGVLSPAVPVHLLSRHSLGKCMVIHSLYGASLEPSVPHYKPHLIV